MAATPGHPDDGTAKYAARAGIAVRPPFCAGAVIGLLVWALPVAANAQTVDQQSWNWGHMMDSRWGWGGMMGGGIAMVLFWAVLIALVAYLLVRPSSRRTSNGQRAASALDILEERFARGEIDEREFHDRRQVLLSRPRRQKGNT
ncbi:SHOCT domain-containing protein [Aurantimonas sp. A2-1-M11]|uniref:SHOCT domain-containing protein n=1 Tax=Aurantimonas sp. A2-1-M11 TaxID=3113712 RepID=UPI002F94367A